MFVCDGEHIETRFLQLNVPPDAVERGIVSFCYQAIALIDLPSPEPGVLSVMAILRQLCGYLQDVEARYTLGNKVMGFTFNEVVAALRPC
jgi:hypothetical protein